METILPMPKMSKPNHQEHRQPWKAQGLWVSGLGFRVEGLGLRGLGFRRLGFRVLGGSGDLVSTYFGDFQVP